ncbi:MAG TPA: hypothetical protein VJV79_23710 [Polyangiaceae bacterium]|nr:hypothetical protein [Polyangiaceae bacterium]
MVRIEKQSGSKILRMARTYAERLGSMAGSGDDAVSLGGARQRAQRRMISRLAVATVAAGATLGFAGTAHAIHRSGQVNVAPGQTGTIDLNCPAGYGNIVSGGGVTTTPQLRIIGSFPLPDFVTWRVIATNLTGSTQTLYAGATCRTGFVSYDMRAVALPTGAYAVGESVASCLGTRQAMGGGFLVANANVPIIGSRIQGNNWRVRAYNGNSGTTNITSFVTCSGSLPARVDTNPPDTTTVGPGGVAFPTKYCPSGWLASGGFWSNIDHNWTIVTGSLPNQDTSGNSLWKWNFRNWDSVSHTYERTISCF